MATLITTVLAIPLFASQAAAVSPATDNVPKKYSAANVRELFVSLPLDTQARLISDFALATGMSTSGSTLTRDHPARIQFFCDGAKCDGNYLQTAKELSEAFPKLFGGLTDDGGAADIELFLSPDDNAYRKRDREIDRTLRSNVMYSLQSAPCKYAIYHNAQNEILKSLIYIDSTLPSENIESCIEADVAYAVGALGAGQTKAPFDKLSAEDHHLLRLGLDIVLMFQATFAGHPTNYKDVKKTLFESFSLPQNEGRSSP